MSVYLRGNEENMSTYSRVIAIFLGFTILLTKVFAQHHDYQSLKNAVLQDYSKYQNESFSNSVLQKNRLLNLPLQQLYIDSEERFYSPWFTKDKNWFGMRESYSICDEYKILESISDPVVIDLDDLSTLAAGTQKTGAGMLAQGTILVAGGTLAFYGTKTAIDQLLLSSARLKQLSDEKKLIVSYRKNNHIHLSVPHELLSEEVKLLITKTEAYWIQNLAAMVQDNKNKSINETIKYYFSGVSAGIGTAGMGVGDLSHPGIWAPILGGHSKVLAVLSVYSSTILYMAVPFVSLFASANAGRESYNVFQTYRLTKEDLESSLPNDILEMLIERTHKIRRISSGSAASYTMEAIGAPLTLALGPVGLSVLLPGVIGMISTGFTKKRNIDYTKRLSMIDIIEAGDFGMIFNILRFLRDDIEAANKILKNKNLSDMEAINHYLDKHLEIKNRSLHVKSTQLQNRLANLVALSSIKEVLKVDRQLIFDQIGEINLNLKQIINERKYNKNDRNILIKNEMTNFSSDSLMLLIQFLKQNRVEASLVQEIIKYIPYPLKQQNQSMYRLEYLYNLLH